MRLRLLFPPDAFDTVTSDPLAAAATAAMLYVGAVVPDGAPSSADSTWARPSVCLWLSDAAYAHTAEQERSAWLAAALRHRRKVAELLTSWGEPFEPWYADNTRETLRDETFPRWLDFGAMRYREGVRTTSSQPRWALAESFADLFDPAGQFAAGRAAGCLDRDFGAFPARCGPVGEFGQTSPASAVGAS